MELFCRVTEMGFVPLDDTDYEVKKKLHLGTDVCVRISMPRNLRFHRKFMALLRLTVDNMRESVQKDLNIYNVDALLAAVKIDMGYYDTFKVGNRYVIKLRSISFAKMDETQFGHFYDLAVTDILNRYLMGTNRNALLQEVEEFYS